MEQDSNSVQPAPDRQLSTETTPPANDATTTPETQDTASSTDLPPPAPSGPEGTPMDEFKSLKWPHVSDSDSDTAKQIQPSRRPSIYPKPNTSIPRNKENVTSTKT